MNPLLDDNKDNFSLTKVILLVFVPTTIFTASYVLLGYVLNTIPSLLLFFLLATLILLPTELVIVFRASKKAYGRYSLTSALVHQEKVCWKHTFIYAFLLFAFAGIVSVTIGSFENWITAPLSNRLFEIMPSYYDWSNLEYLRQYPKNTVLLTCIVYSIFNIIIGPVIEEFYFRGYLTSKISRFGKWSPVIITILFSLYHLWLPLQNIFRIFAFLPAAYISWYKKNIYISIVFHCLCNLLSTISFIVAVYSI